MEPKWPKQQDDSRERIEDAYKEERPRLMTRLRHSGRSFQEAEDMVHDAYVELLERLPIVSEIRNLPAWLHSLLGRRLIDAWRHDRVRRSVGEIRVAEETIDEIITGVGLDPQDAVVREYIAEAINDAIKALPAPQRKVIEAQVFGGLTFREIAEATGESIDALTARKRYALRRLSRALKYWIAD